MGESLTVRLFVQTQTYDIPCDPRQPATWLLQQAKTIQQRLPHKPAQEDQLEVLYNRTRRQVVDLSEPIGRTISPMDVIDARTLLQTEATYPSAMFPWLRGSATNGAFPTGDGKSDGLFFQQLYAFAMLDKRTPLPASQVRQKQKEEHFLRLLQAYVSGAYDDQAPAAQVPPAPTVKSPVGPVPQPSHAQPQFFKPMRRDKSPSNPIAKPVATKEALLSPVYRRSENTADNNQDELNTFRLSNGEDSRRHSSSASYPGDRSPSSSSALAAMRNSTHSSTASDAGHEMMDNVFDIVFKEQAIGMRLGSDDTKQYAIVKECFEGSEARRYPEIQHGVVILAVNGQDVTGVGLSRILYRLREAPRPVVVRFGRLPSQSSPFHAVSEYSHLRSWG